MELDYPIDNLMRNLIYLEPNRITTQPNLIMIYLQSVNLSFLLFGTFVSSTQIHIDDNLVRNLICLEPSWLIMQPNLIVIYLRSVNLLLAEKCELIIQIWFAIWFIIQLHHYAI